MDAPPRNVLLPPNEPKSSREWPLQLQAAGCLQHPWQVRLARDITPQLRKISLIPTELHHCRIGFVATHQRHAVCRLGGDRGSQPSNTDLQHLARPVADFGSASCGDVGSESSLGSVRVASSNSCTNLGIQAPYQARVTCWMRLWPNASAVSSASVSPLPVASRAAPTKRGSRRRM